MAVKLERLLNNMVVRTASQFSLYILDHIWKKEDKLVVFTGLDGKWYTDNSRYLFEHCLRNNPNDLKFVWVTRNQDLIDRMERDGLVKRVPDPEDRRVLRIFLTDMGHTIQDTVAPTVDRVMTQILSGIDDKDIAHLKGTLRKVLANIHDENIDEQSEK